MKVIHETSADVVRDTILKSIKHWEDNIIWLEQWRGKKLYDDFAEDSPNGIGIYSHDCALCNLYNQGYEDEGKCAGCPVAIASGENGCYSNPYDTISYLAADYYDQPIDQRLIDACLLELDFLWNVYYMMGYK